MAQTSILGRIGQLVRANINAILDSGRGPREDARPARPGLHEQHRRGRGGRRADRRQPAARRGRRPRGARGRRRVGSQGRGRVAPRRRAPRRGPPGEADGSTTSRRSRFGARSATRARPRRSRPRPRSRPSSPTSSRTGLNKLRARARSWSRSATSSSAGRRWPRPRRRSRRRSRAYRSWTRRASSTASRSGSGARRRRSGAWRRSAASSLEEQFADRSTPTRTSSRSRPGCRAGSERTRARPCARPPTSAAGPGLRGSIPTVKQMYHPSDLAAMDPLVLMKNLDHVRMTSRRLATSSSSRSTSTRPRRTSCASRSTATSRPSARSRARWRGAASAPDRRPLGEQRLRVRRACAASRGRRRRPERPSAAPDPRPRSPYGGREAAASRTGRTRCRAPELVVAPAAEQAPARDGAHLVVQLRPADAPPGVAEADELLGFGRDGAVAGRATIDTDPPPRLGHGGADPDPRRDGTVAHRRDGFRCR